jgi:hypothetical protein
MRTATCFVMFLLLMIAGKASAAALAQPNHHYSVEVPPGWEQVSPSEEADFELRPVGATTDFPKLTIAYESVKGEIDPYVVERNLRNGLTRKQPGQQVTLILDSSNYDPRTQQITLDYHAVEFGRTTKRCTMVCRIGDGMLIGCNLASYSLTYDLHKSALTQLLTSLRIDAGYEFRGATRSDSTPVVKPEPRQLQQREPTAEPQPEPATPARREPASLVPYILGGALCSFTGVVVLMLGIVGIIVMSTRRKPKLAV